MDGNIWIHNAKCYSFGIGHNQPNGVQITVIARGNIYFSDNFLLKNVNKDAVAFVAIKDPVVADSGNIYFGDPVYGTIAKMEGIHVRREQLQGPEPRRGRLEVHRGPGDHVRGQPGQDRARHLHPLGKTSHSKLTVTLDNAS